MKRQLEVLAFIIGMAVALTASARVPLGLREARHSNWFSFAMGPSIPLENAPTQLLLVQTFGHHFTRHSGGPAIAIDMQEHLFGGLFVFQTGPRFVYDIQPVKGLGFYLAPSVGLEYTITNSGPYQGFSVPFLFKMKLVVGRRALLFFQPVGIDLMGLFHPGWNSYLSLQYDLLFGVGVVF